MHEQRKMNEMRGYKKVNQEKQRGRLRCTLTCMCDVRVCFPSDILLALHPGHFRLDINMLCEKRILCWR